MSRWYRSSRDQVEQGITSVVQTIGRMTDLYAKYEHIITEEDVQLLKEAAIALAVLIEHSEIREVAE